MITDPAAPALAGSAPAFSVSIPDVTGDVDLAVKAVRGAMHQWIDDNREELGRCSPADFVDLILRVALTYLTSNGLVATAPEGAFEHRLPAGLEAPYAGAMAGRLVDATLRPQRIAAAVERFAGEPSQP